MKYFWLFGLASILTGCLASNALSYDSECTTNQYHLAKVRKGMSEKQVLQIMHKPYSYETFRVEDDVYDVWFYVTKPTGLDQTRMVAQNLTPLTFKNGILVGTGYTWYYYAMKANSLELEPQKAIPFNHSQNNSEDEASEKALSVPGKTTNSRFTEPAHGQQPQTSTEKVSEPAHTESGTNSTNSLNSQHQTPPQHQVSPRTNHKDLKQSTNGQIISKSEPMSCEPCPMNDRDVNKRAGEWPLDCGACKNDKCKNRFDILVIGMTESQVYKAFGKPKSYQTFYMGHDTYDVWFYETYPSEIENDSYVPQHMTPLTFKNARLFKTSDEGFYAIKAKVEQHNQMEVARKRTALRAPAQSIKPCIAVKPIVAVSMKKFSKVKKGMTEEQVKAQIGEAVDEETYLVNNDHYRVWFYKIDRKKDLHKPVVFKNGVVYGTSLKTYNKIRNQAGQESIDCYTPATQKLQEDAADQNFNYW